MKLLEVTIVQGTGPDYVSIQTDLPSPCPNFDVTDLQITFTVAADGGPAYVAEHFPGVPVKLIGRPKPLYRFSRPRPAAPEDELVGRAVKSYKGLRP
jgi:hypothetical protein